MDEKYPNRFKPGQSGNPAGRPPGSRNKATVIAEALIEGQVEAVVQAATERALKGSDAAQRLLLTRLVPAAQRRTVTFDLPKTETLSDIAPAHGALLQAVAAGTLTAEEARTTAAVLDAQRRAFETAELAERVARIEEALGLDPG
jgi:hypothetical protein